MVPAPLQSPPSEDRPASVGLLAIAVPNATAFVASLCIMVVELVAGRLIARHVGSSLYTWTSVIGVVLAGIAIGNWIGGRLADRYRPAGVLGVLFSLASLCCFSAPVLNKVVGNWPLLWKQEWALRIAAHVFLVFFLPSGVLGSIGPVAAKMALDLGRQKGRTVGGVYAWGAVGSIVGTFLTGFVLISRMGTIAVLVSVGIFMALVAILFGVRAFFPYLWAAAALGLVVAIIGPWSQTTELATRLGFLRERFANVIYVEESQYSHIQVEIEEDPPGMRAMSLDHLIHAYVVMGNQGDLQYDYEKLYASITRSAMAGRDRVSTLFIGGGGFVFPRYILLQWPASHVEVAEIDPQVTRAAHVAFGLPFDTPMRIYNLDARNHVDDLLRRKQRGEPVPAFDFVYGDAFNHYAVPFHLTTLEFNLKLRQLMSSQGVYIMNILDIYHSGKFLGAILNTFRRSFPHVYAFSTVDNGPSTVVDRRDTFVVVGAMRPLQGQALAPGVSGAALRPEHFQDLRQRSGNIVLTDDYAPVEQLLEPVVRLSEREG